ncbi:aconitate hydratase, putative, Aquifex type [Sphaerochaeta pleomorpha str. Grapes]|uniref:Aconitate hydratase A n=1 Tax=Sphaerochaeta pleomorpha (strain ATCC BAA-1885 / DSM 22778 / Grapes) TaxID=158190 RepID=G8QY14_SPHPG|nr:aconitate hydratase [Sphaerochaeta pleomorpha]AEV28519.1 aconitate hydratase, putative, Aquifex type [Sphaerochaeta pleomorpha str. Grapes]
MGKTLTEKILSSHLEEGCIEAGKPIGIHIDQTLTQDATGTMAYLQFESMGLDRIKNELAVSYVDHNTVQVGFENADDHRYLQSVAASKGIVFSRAGNGICHQVHLERFGAPGKTLLGSDSHTPTGGGLAMIAIGAGGLDVAVAMAGGPFHIISPKVVEIRLSGKLRPWVSAKDVILAVLEHFTVKGNVNCVFEYTGEGVKTLQVTDRATICNMGAECGVTTSLFPSDENTLAFLQAQGRAQDYVPLLADSDAVYDQLFELDLSVLEPLCACPHSPGNIARMKDFAGKKIDQVLIGSCTNSSYTDMKKVADILDGHTVSEHVSLGIAPGSREVLLMLASDGSLAKMIASGARILESACGFCIGNHQSPNTNGISLRTSNRNFEGRSGTKSGQLYLVSPESAALSAIAGTFVDPLGNHGIAYPQVSMPEKFIIDDRMFIFPPLDGSQVEIVRGPNIGNPPINTPLAKNLKGVVAIKVGDKITTDHIMPAGARLKYRSNIPEYSKYVFEPVDPLFPARAAKNRDAGVGNVIVAGASYGQGSSREHAAICPMFLGVKAVVAISIERIHQNNLCNFGIVPLTFKDEKDYLRISEGDELVIDDIVSQISTGTVVLTDKTANLAFSLDCHCTEDQKEMLLAGGLLNVLKGEK